MFGKQPAWAQFLTAFAAVMFAGLSFGAAVPPIA
jgi:hypothetical protein